jgi:hypothetical protein
MSSMGSASGSPKPRDFCCVKPGAPSRMMQMSRLVPPMSQETESRMPSSREIATAAVTPAAVPTGSY